MATPQHSAAEPPEIQELDRERAAGWQYFTRFLTLNVVVTVVSLLLIAAVTVWS